MDGAILETLKKLYSASSQKAIITDLSLSVLWTNLYNTGNTLDAEMFSLSNAVDASDGIFPLTGERTLFFKSGVYGYTARAIPLTEDGIYIFVLSEPMDTIKESVFSQPFTSFQNSFAQIREAVAEIYSGGIMLKERTSELSDGLYHTFKHIDNSCYKILGTISNYSELFKLAEGNLTESTIDLGGYIQELCYLCTSFLRNENVSITATIQPSSLVKCDCDRLTTAFLNLIANAVSYNISEHKLISVSVKTIGDEVSLSVTDNGYGMTLEQIERTTVPFGLCKFKDSGSGLGLYVVRQFADSCGASVTISSRQNDGTSVHIRFPKVGNSGDIDFRSPIKDNLGASFSPVTLYLSKLISE